MRVVIEVETKKPESLVMLVGLVVHQLAETEAVGEKIEISLPQGKASIVFTEE